MDQGATNVHPVAMLITLAMGVCMMLVRRDRAVVPLLVVACFVTHAQRIVVAGFDFSMLRILILFGWARVLARSETAGYRFHPLDAILPIWLLMGTIAYTFGPRGSMQYFINQLGTSFDAAGIYFLFRIILRDLKDVYGALRTFAAFAILLIGPMLVEWVTGRNIFAFLGGVPERTIVRDGRMRCQASFSHAIMAGNFGASALAMAGALWLGFPKRRLFNGLAMVASIGVVVFSSSSGPLMAFMTVTIGWGLWLQRQHMRLFRRVTAVAMVVIHFAREKPIWHLIGRLSSITGGTGYHRYQLIDQFVKNFGEWWFLGAFTTAHWAISGPARDITNQYVLEGVRGGLPRLIAFVILLIVAFQTVGRTVRLAMSSDWSPRQRRRAAYVAWGLGVCLAAHSVAFIGVSYFGQLLSILYLQIAMIPAFHCAVLRARSRTRSQPAPSREPGGNAPAPAAAPEPVLADLMRGGAFGPGGRV